jgi:hypothetical protein
LAFTDAFQYHIMMSVSQSVSYLKGNLSAFFFVFNILSFLKTEKRFYFYSMGGQMALNYLRAR